MITIDPYDSSITNIDWIVEAALTKYLSKKKITYVKDDAGENQIWHWFRSELNLDMETGYYLWNRIVHSKWVYKNA